MLTPSLTHGCLLTSADYSQVGGMTHARASAHKHTQACLPQIPQIELLRMPAHLRSSCRNIVSHKIPHIHARMSACVHALPIRLRMPAHLSG